MELQKWGIRFRCRRGKRERERELESGRAERNRRQGLSRYSILSPASMMGLSVAQAAVSMYLSDLVFPLPSVCSGQGLW